MRITQEADYAVRIIDCLARKGMRLDGRELSDQTGVTLRFTLKILRKLSLARIVKSYKGVQGGYELLLPPAAISLRSVIEAVDGPIVVNKGLSGGLPCSKLEDSNICYYHTIFEDVSKTIRDKLENIHFGDHTCDDK